jgi:hypothetical protein
MHEFKKGTAHYGEAFKGIAVSANPDYRGPAAKKKRTIRPEHGEDKRAKSRLLRKLSATPADVRAAALRLAHEILAPMIDKSNSSGEEGDEISWFARNASRISRKGAEEYNRKSALGVLRRMREGKETVQAGNREVKVRLSNYEKFLCDRVHHLLHCLTDLAPEIFEDAHNFIGSLPDELMEPRVRQSVHNTLRSIEGLLRKVSDRGRGSPAGKPYDWDIAVAVVQVAEGFGLHSRRDTAMRNEIDADRESACSIVCEKLRELLLSTSGDFIEPLTESEIELSYERSRREPWFWVAFKLAVLERLKIAREPQLWNGPWDESLLKQLVPGISEHDLKILRCAANANPSSGVQGYSAE